MKITKTLKIATIVAAIALFAAQPAVAAVNLTGAGSTFAIPLLDSCKAGFTAATGNTITYSGGGSGAGRSASDKGIGDVNFSDTPHTGATRLATVIHVPILAAPIAVMYNFRTARPLNLSPDTVAGIFSGKITKWNDPKIVAENNRAFATVVYKKNSKGEVLKDKTGSPIVLKTVTTRTHLTLPAKTIQVIYRSDSSGTSGNFTAFLHGMAPSLWPNPSNGDFKASFPGNINDSGNLGRIVAAAGSPGVATLAGKTPYSITYAEKNFAKAAGLNLANIENAAGNYQAPDAGGTSDFLGAATVDSSGFLTFDYNTKEAGAYPLGIVSYALVDTKGKNASAVADFLSYLLDPKCPGTDPSLGYTTITGALYALDVKQIAKLR